MANQIKIQITIDRDDADWFRDVYGTTHKGPSYSWLFTMLMKEFRRAHRMTPQDYARLGAEELKKLVEESNSDASHL